MKYFLIPVLIISHALGATGFADIWITLPNKATLTQRLLGKSNLLLNTHLIVSECDKRSVTTQELYDVVEKFCKTQIPQKNSDDAYMLKLAQRNVLQVLLLDYPEIFLSIIHPVLQSSTECCTANIPDWLTL